MALAFVVELLPAVEAARQARGNLRVAVVQVEDAVGEEGIALRGMEADQVGAETAQQGVDLVRVAGVEGRMFGQRLDLGQASGRRLVDCTASHLSTTSASSFHRVVELGQRLFALRADGGIDVGQRREGGELVGHVVGGLELLQASWRVASVSSSSR